jgi:hypothetical protein
VFNKLGPAVGRGMLLGILTPMQQAKNEEKHKFIEFLKSHPYVKIIFPLAPLVGGGDIIGKMQKGELPVVGVTFIVCFIAYISYLYGKIKIITLKAASDTRYFYPFLSSLPQSEKKKFLEARPIDIERLKLFLETNRTEHLIISGDSGTGKSTLLELYHSNSMPKEIVRIAAAQITSPYDFAKRVLFGSVSDSELDSKLINSFNSIFDRSGKHDINRDWANFIKLYKIRFLKQRQLMIFLDQSERLVEEIHALGEIEENTIFTFLNVLKTSTQINTVFVVRSDYLARLIAFLPESKHDIMFVYGIAAGPIDESSSETRRRFEKVSADSLERDAIIKMMRERTKPNTLIFNLAGYIVECGYSDRITNYRNPSGYNGSDQILDIYIQLVIEEYSFLNKSHTKATELLMLLYVIAVFHRRRNIAFSKDDISAISHLSLARVDEAFIFLERRGLIQRDQEMANSYYFAHDLVAEHLIRREYKGVHVDYQVAVAQLIERRVPRSQMIRPDEEKNPFLSILNDGKLASFWALPLWAAAALYGSRIAFPEKTYDFFDKIGIHSVLNAWIPGVVNNYGFSTWFFAPVLIAQYIWVMFMYGLAQGCLKYVLQSENRKISLFTINLCGGFGALLGYLFSFAPSLFIIPIAVPGFVLISVYFLLSYDGDDEKRIFSYFWELTYGTMGNMIISICVCIGMVELFLLRGGSNKFIFDAITLSAVCALYCYFAFQMRRWQGSYLGRVAMLTLYEAGRRRIT